MNLILIMTCWLYCTIVFFLKMLYMWHSLMARSRAETCSTKWNVGLKTGLWMMNCVLFPFTYIYIYTGWRTKCHTIDCARNKFLLLQKHLTSGTELILIGWKIVPNEEHVQCDHRFASQPPANGPLHSSQLFDTSLQKARGTTSLCGPWTVLHFLASWPNAIRQYFIAAR